MGLRFVLLLTFRTIVATMHPRIGGRVVADSSSMCERESFEDTSHFGVDMTMFSSESSRTTSDAAAEAAPDLDGTSRYFAPLVAIHLSIERPMPPRPPAIRYVAFSSNVQVLRFISSFYCGVSSHSTSLRVSSRGSSHTWTFVDGSTRITIRPVFFPVAR